MRYTAAKRSWTLAASGRVVPTIWHLIAASLDMQQLSENATQEPNRVAAVSLGK
ncbi:hypothetical protein BH23CHL5_BH23CHL5_26730 [soil metagenome]